MSSSTLAYESRRAQGIARARDYLELTRPRIAAMVLVTVTVGAFLGAWGLPDPWLLFHTLMGTLLVAASAGAFNQWLERETDARMPRTASRPLPDGRMHALEVVAFGTVSAVAGVAWLAVAVNPRTALLGLATWLLYVWVYTPLK
jgi:protoheme IX farnesyltransferase